MLRLIVLLLVLANGLYFAWSQGYLRPYGYGPQSQAEPQRVQRQLRPADMQVLNAQEAARAEAPPTPAPSAKPPECLRAGLFNEQQVADLERALQDKLPAGAWQMDEVVVPARWIIYMGRYANVGLRERKRDELKNLHIKYEPLSRADMEPGLSLGAFQTQEQARAGLQALNRRGVRTARVVLERAEQRGRQLRVPEADDALKSRLEEMAPLLAGNTFRPCQ